MICFIRVSISLAERKKVWCNFIVCIRQRSLLHSEMDLNDNPFAKVFPTIEDAQNYALKVNEAGRTIFLHELDGISAHNLQGEDLIINKLVEEVFNFTICKNSPSLLSGIKSELVYFEDVSGKGKLTFDDLDTLQFILFERLLLEDPSTNLKRSKLPNKSTRKPNVYKVSHVVETRCFYYLFKCYCRLRRKCQEKYEDIQDIIAKMIEYIISNASTALKQPEVYEKQNLHQQVEYEFIKAVRQPGTHYAAQQKFLLGLLINFVKNKMGLTVKIGL